MQRRVLQAGGPRRFGSVSSVRIPNTTPTISVEPEDVDDADPAGCYPYSNFADTLVLSLTTGGMTNEVR